MKTYTSAEWAIDDTETTSPVEATMLAVDAGSTGTPVNTTLKNGTYIPNFYMYNGIIVPLLVKKQEAGITEGDVLFLW